MAGDLVALHFRPEIVRAGELQSSLKRLVLPPPPFVKFPFKDHADSNVRAVIIVEMLNPPRRFVSMRHAARNSPGPSVAEGCDVRCAAEGLAYSVDREG
jgi:hypothetical protein